MRRLAYAALVLGAFLAGVVTGCATDDWFDADTCLDRGGAWDYEHESCRYA